MGRKRVWAESAGLWTTQPLWTLEMTDLQRHCMMASVSKNLGSSLTPAAVRATRPGWRDRRLWVGIAIVAMSVVLGARVVGAADESAPVWSLQADMGAGDTLGDADVVAREVRFVHSSDADRYLSADEPLPDGATLIRAVGAGELLPRTAVGATSASGLATLTLTFEGAGVPVGLAQGDHVDVYVTSVEEQKSGTPGDDTAVRWLREALVTDVQRGADSLVGAGGREVTIGIADEVRAEAVAAVVQAAKTDNIYLVKQG